MTADSEDILRQIPALRRYARALTQDAQRADDLVQDCLERAWRRLDSWQRGTDLRAWLFTIMHNVYVNQVRRYRNAPTFLPLEAADSHSGVSGGGEDGLQLRDLEAAIAALPEAQRQVLLLVALEALRYDEVAAILGIPIGTVMSRLHRARERLRGWMDGDHAQGLRRVK